MSRYRGQPWWTPSPDDEPRQVVSRCRGCGGPLAAARCPMCDPRPNSADRAAGCVCPDGRGIPFADWQPVDGCPVHTPTTIREDPTT